MYEMIINNVPERMKSTEKWTGYKREKDEKGREKNVPKTINRKKANPKNPATWSKFNQVVEKVKSDEWFDGISFSLGDNFIGFDFDNVRNKETGEFSETCKHMIKALEDSGAYVEISPSGTGVHAILWWESAHLDKDIKKFLGNKSGRKAKLDNNGVVEFYIHTRIFATTGNITDGCSYRESSDHKKCALKILEQLSKKSKPNNKDSERQTRSFELDDDKIKELLFSEKKNGDKWRDLYENGYNEATSEYLSQSEADSAIFAKLAFYTARNIDQMVSLFEQSALNRSSKGKDYNRDSAESAAEICSEVYRGNGNGKKKTNKKKKKTEDKPTKNSDHLQGEKVYLNMRYETKDSEGNDKYIIGARKTTHAAEEIIEKLGDIDPNKSLVFVKDQSLGFIRNSVKESELDEFIENDQFSIVSEFNDFDKETAAGKLNKLFDFYKYNKNGDPYLLEELNPRVAGQLIKTVDLFGVPSLNGIMNHPYYSKKWELINEPGWNKSTKFYMNPSKTVEITDMSVSDAYVLLSAWLRDFPFKEESDKMNALAMYFTTLIRPALPYSDLAPLFVITANIQGTGKSTLARALPAAVLGYDPGSTSISTDKEEMRKAIGAELFHGTEFVVLDNAEENVPVNSEAIAVAVTEPKIRYRYLTRTRMIESDNNATYALTGNNVTLNADLTARSVFIRLNTKVVNAERDFQIDNFLNYTIQNQQQLVSAGCAIINQYIKDFREDSSKKYGSKKHRQRGWARYISAIMETLKRHVDYDKLNRKQKSIISDEFNSMDKGYSVFDEFLNNDREAKLRAEPEFSDWCDFRDKVRKEYKDEHWTVRDVFHIGSFRDGCGDVDDNLFGAWFNSGDKYHEASRRKGLGIYIASNTDKVLGNWKLVVSRYQKDNRKAYIFKEVNENVPV